MALTTIAFCHNCKWRSSENPIQRDVAGAPCPTCGSGVSAIHCDPAFTGTVFGQPYVEADAINEELTRHGIATANPQNAVPLPTHRPIVSPVTP